MKVISKFLLPLLLVFSIAVQPQAAEPLRVFIRAGVKTHGPNQHDHPRFLQEWKPLLTQRGGLSRGRPL